MGFFDTISDTVEDTVDKAEETVDDVVEGAQDAAREISQGAQDTTEEVSEGDVGGAVDEATETAGEVVDTAEDTAQETTGIDFGGSGGGSSDTDTETSESSFSSGGSGGGSSGGSVDSSGTSEDSSIPETNSDTPETSGRSTQPQGSGSSDLKAFKRTLPGNQATQNREVSPGNLPINKQDARDADIVSQNVFSGGNILENPAEREFSRALNPSQPDTVTEDLNQRKRAVSANRYFQGQEQTRQLEDRKDELSGTIDRVQSAPENSRYTITTTNSEGETVTRVVGKDEALSNLRNSRERLNQDIQRVEESSFEAAQNVFSLPGDTKENKGQVTFADLRSSRPEQDQQSSNIYYRRNPNAVKEINQLQEQLSNSVMSKEQRESIQNRINDLRSEARMSAEIPGQTNIPGQSPGERLPLPEGAESNVVQRGGTVNEIKRGVNNRVDNFLSRPEPENVENVELSNDLGTQVAAGVSTLASSKGFSYVGNALVPGGKTAEDVAEEQIKDNFRNPSTGSERAGEILVESPAGLAATAGAGTAVGAGTKAASVIGGSRAGIALKAAGAGLTGYFVGTQGQKASTELQKGRPGDAVGTALRTAGELGAFSKGYRSFQKFDQPKVLRTTVSSADNTLRKVDDELVGAGTVTARTNFQRGPFSRKVLGRDDVDTLETDVNYRVAADESGAEAQGTLTQELPDSDNSIQKDLQAKSIVKSTGTDSQGRKVSATRDIVRTEQEGTLFRSTSNFKDTTLNRRVNQRDIDSIQLRNDKILVQGESGSFVNPGSSVRDGVVLNRDVSGRVSRYESLSLGDSNQRQTFGESRNLVITDSGSGSVGRTAGGGSGARYRFDERDERINQFGEPVNREGVRELSEQSSRESLEPDTGLDSFSGAGAGSTVQGNQLEQDGQETFEAQGDLQNQFQDRNQGERSLDTDVRNTDVQVQDTQSNLESVERTTAGSVDVQDSSQGQETKRISRVRDSVSEDVSPGTDVDTGTTSTQRSRPFVDQGQGQRNRLDQRQKNDLEQGTVNFQAPKVASVQRSSVKTAQIPRSKVRTRQRPRSRLSFVSSNVSAPRGTGRAGFPGFDFGGLRLGSRESGAEKSSVSRGRADLTYDLVGTFEAESVGGEQAKFRSGDGFRDKQLKEQNQLGAFVRNKPVQASAGGSTSSSTDFF